MTCCENPKLVNGVCENCCSQVETLSFIEEFELNPRTTNKARINKFREFIFSKAINNFCRTTLLDMFPRIEHEFFVSDRKNFVNLNQLVRELLPIIGYPEYLPLFPPLKTKSRCLQIKKLVDKCFKDEGVPCKRLEDLEYLEPRVDFVDMSKVMLEHTYSDLNNINDRKTETETEGKTSSGSKTKTKR